MQLFNLINAKKLGEHDYNIFKGFFSNYFFIFILVLSFGIQIAMVEYGGRAMRCENLTWQQNLICAAIGAFSLIWAVVIKALMPARWFDSLAMNEKEMTDEEETHTFTANLRRSFRQSTLKNLEVSRKSLKI